MANVISLTFNNNINLRAEKYLYQNDADDDIFNGINSNFGNITQVYTPSEFIVTNSIPIDRPSGGNVSVDSTAESWKVHILNYYIVPYFIVIRARRAGSGAQVDISASCRTGLNNSTDAFDKILFDTFNTNEAQVYTSKEVSLEYRSLVDTFAVRRDNSRSNFDSNFFLSQFYVYGYIFRKDGDIIPPVKAATTLGDMKDSFTNLSDVTQGVLEFTDTLNVVPNQVLKTSTQILSGNINLNNTNEFTVYILDPNGADRDVILPDPALKDTYIKIININGNNRIIVKEDTIVVANLSTADVTLVSECIYNGNEWIVTNG